MKDEADRLAEEAVERLLPPESPAFFDELWSRIEADASARHARRGLLVGVMAAAVAVVAAAAVYAAPALLSGRAASLSVRDETYSCRVQPRPKLPAIDVNGGVALPPLPHLQRPADVLVSTILKREPPSNTLFSIPTVSVKGVKDGVSVDRAACRRSSRRVVLKPTGLAADTTVTPDFRGSFGARCVTAKRVIVRFRLTLREGVPTRGLLTIRNDDARDKPIAFVNWSTTKITPFWAKSCVVS